MSFMENFLNKVSSKPKQYCLEKTIHRQTVVDMMAAWLYATSVLDDNQEVMNIQFGELSGKELVQMKIFIKEVKTKK